MLLGETEYITAHELFDALPYHMFKLTREYGWREMLIDRTTPSVSPSVSSDSANTTGDALRFVVSARRTDALDYFLKVQTKLLDGCEKKKRKKAKSY